MAGPVGEEVAVSVGLEPEESEGTRVVWGRRRGEGKRKKIKEKSGEKEEGALMREVIHGLFFEREEQREESVF